MLSLSGHWKLFVAVGHCATISTKARLDTWVSCDRLKASHCMKIISRTILFSAVASTFGVVSCGTVSKVSTSSLAFVKDASSATTQKVAQLSTMAIDKINPPSVKVVEVREKDLKKLPTGQERALAYENTRKRFWFFGGPVDFTEPTLPAQGGEMDGSLLPPKDP